MYVEAFVGDRQRLLTFGVQLALSQLVQQASLICRLQQTRSECTMHLDRSPDDFVSKPIHPVHLCALGDLCGE